VSWCCVLYSPPGRNPAAVGFSGTLDASDAALCASERTQAARGVCRRRHVLANMSMRGQGKGVRPLDVTRLATAL
jgi:hypothetical protein